MAFDPLRLAPMIPTETPVTDSATVDLTSAGDVVNPTSFGSQVVVNEANEMTKDEITEWFQNITANLRFRKNHWNGIESWYRFKQLYAGYHFGGWKKRPSMITVNTAYAVVRNLIPDLYFTDPYIYVTPGRDGDEFTAALTEHAVNQEWRKRIKGKRTIRRCLLDYGIFGWSISKTGYRFLSDVARNLAKDGEIEFERYHELDQIYSSRTSPFNIVWDFIGSPSPLDSPWVAELIIRPVKDVMVDATLKNTKGIKASAMPNIQFSTFEDEIGTKYFGSFTGSNEIDTARSFVFMWNIYDRKHNKLKVIAEGMEENALRMIDIPFGFVPYDFLMIDEIPDEPFPISPIGSIEDQILERDRVRTRQFGHWKRFGRKYKYLRGQVDAGELAKLRRGDDGVTIGLKNLDAIGVIEDSSLPSDVLVAEGQAKSDIIEIIGVQRSIAPSATAKQSATQSRRTAVLEDKRSVDRRSLVADFMEEIVGKVIIIMRHEFTFPRIVKISGGTLGQFFISYTRNDIIENADVNVDVAQLQPEDPALLRKQLLDMYMVFRGDQNINQRELAKRAMKAFPNMKDIDALFIQETLFDNPIFKLVQQQAQGTRTEGGMNPGELLRLLRTLMAGKGLGNPIQNIPNDPNQATQSRTPGNLLKQPPVRPGAAEGNISNLRNRGINP